VHFTLRNVLELSKNIVTSIQQNLREFSERNQDAVMPDSILDHRRPKSGQMGSGAAAGMMGAGGTGMGMGMGALNPAYFEEDEGDNIFDPEDYAFMRREKRRGGAGGGGGGETKRSGSPVKAGAGGGGYSTTGNDADAHEVVSCSSPSKTAAVGAGAANSGSHGTGTGTGTGWPTKRTVLHSMEFIIGGLLFVSDYTWIPQKMLTEVVAHQFISK
jgi:hypothetical protein